MTDRIDREVTRGTVARSVLAASIGNAVEWCDWTVYATFAVFFTAGWAERGRLDRRDEDPVSRFVLSIASCST